MNPILRVGLIGFGKIARDQHLPAIAATQGIELVATASRNSRAEGLPGYRDIDELVAGEPNLDAVIMCQPPQFRYAAARRALAAGKHVFLEKPPGATLSEVEALITLARAQGVCLFASWHSRYAPAVAPARAWLETRTLRRASIVWKEDVRHWHPGQTWIFEAGGFGVFDPGINALSILTEVIGQPVRLVEADLETPINRAAPIGARLVLETASGAPIEAQFDFRQTGQQTWDISFETDGEVLRLSEGGHKLAINGQHQTLAAETEYLTMYRHFVDLARTGRVDVDLAPLRLVADAFLSGRNRPTEPFVD